MFVYEVVVTLHKFTLIILKLQTNALKESNIATYTGL